MKHIDFRPIAALACLFLLPAPGRAQLPSAENLARQVREKCLSIQSGHYVADRKMKYMSGSDTLSERITCDFRREPGDTLRGLHFAMKTEGVDGGWAYQSIYTGKEFISFSDSTGTRTQTSKWPDVVANRLRKLNFYAPLTSATCAPVPTEKQLADSSNTFHVSEELVGDKPCYLLRSVHLPNDPPSLGMQCTRVEVNLWIDRQEYLPLQYSEFFELVEAQDTMHQYEEVRLLEFSPKADQSLIRHKAVPKWVQLEDYKPHEPPKPLAEGTQAPDWALPSLAGDTVRLADLRGQVVLLDFFYKACAPCAAAMPALQNLHEKYKDRGLVLLGIDPVDDPVDDQMADFLAKRNVSYTILFSNRNLPLAYSVYAYPTLFLLDRQGRVVTSIMGFSEEMESEVEQLLEKLL